MSKNNFDLETVLKDRGPELTAFALGELSREDREALLEEFKNNPEVLAHMQEMAQLSGLLSETVPQKSKHFLTDEQKEAVLKARPEEKKSFFAALTPKLYMPAFGAAAVVLLVFVLFPKTEDSAIFLQTGEESPYNDHYVFKDETQKDSGAADLAGAETQSEPAADFSEGSVGTELAATNAPAARPQLLKTQASGGRVRLNVSGSSMYRRDESGAGTPGWKGVAYGKKIAVPEEGSFGSAPVATGENNLKIVENIFKSVQTDPLSTFSIDVDTSSYTQSRSTLVASSLPPKGLVRAEEFINYFNYSYSQPKEGKPFSVNVEVTEAPWNKKHNLVRIGLRGKETPAAQRLANNFVFLVDVSGSMTDESKLPLVKKSLKMLLQGLRAQDRVAIVTYSGSTEVVLASTPGNKKQKISDAIDSLNADGSTNGSSGIQLAYKIAFDNKISSGNNRVVLATDGDFNVGVTDEGTLEEMIERKAKKTGVYLTVLGYGMGNYHDSRMQKLANKGNGNNFYIDSEREAHKVLVAQGAGTLNAIAKDVKIQVEFHPKHVQSYRLIGYEKRQLNNEDFNDDQKDAGEIGEGHTVTALYEVIPVGVKGGVGSVDPLKYQDNKVVSSAGPSDELLTVKLRYKKPTSDVSELIEVPVKNTVVPFTKASSDTQFAAAVAGYTMVLTESKFKGDFDLIKAQELAAKNLSVNSRTDKNRAEFVELIKKTRSLKDKESTDDESGGLRKGTNFGGDEGDAIVD